MEKAPRAALPTYSRLPKLLVEDGYAAIFSKHIDLTKLGMYG
jgi:hypothetical protein